MKKYNVKKLYIGQFIIAFSLILSTLIWAINGSDIYLKIAFLIVGSGLVYSSHELSMERSVKYGTNYNFFRPLYIFVGILFILAALYSILNNIT